MNYILIKVSTSTMNMMKRWMKRTLLMKKKILTIIMKINTRTFKIILLYVSLSSKAREHLGAFPREN